MGPETTRDPKEIDEELRALRPWKVTALVSFLLACGLFIVLLFISESWWMYEVELLVGGWIVDGILGLVGMMAGIHYMHMSGTLEREKAWGEARARGTVINLKFLAQSQHVISAALQQSEQIAQAQQQYYRSLAQQQSSSQLSDKLRQLEHAHAQGLLSDEEFAKQRAALLLPDDLGAVVLKCSSCGAQLQPAAGQTSVVCGYCNSLNHLVRS